MHDTAPRWEEGVEEMSSERSFEKIHTPQDQVSLTASGGGTPSDTSVEIDVHGAHHLGLQVIHNYAESQSTDLDVEVYGSMDGAVYDTEPYAKMNVGAGKVKTIPITPGPSRVKVKVANNDAGNATKVSTKLKMGL